MIAQIEKIKYGSSLTIAVVYPISKLRLVRYTELRLAETIRSNETTTDRKTNTTLRSVTIGEALKKCNLSVVKKSSINAAPTRYRDISMYVFRHTCAKTRIPTVRK